MLTAMRSSEPPPSSEELEAESHPFLLDCSYVDCDPAGSHQPNAFTRLHRLPAYTLHRPFRGQRFLGAGSP